MKASTVLEGLLAVKEAVSSNTKPFWFKDCHGVCSNLDGYQLLLAEQVESYHDYSSLHLQSFYPQWPEWSGCDTFPVPSTLKDYTAEEMYMEHRGNMWVKEYGAARLRLLDYLIQRVEALGDSEIIFGEQQCTQQ